MKFTRLSHFAVRTAAVAALAFGLLGTGTASALTAVENPPVGNEKATEDNALELTIILRHDQSRPLKQLQDQLTEQGHYKAFPPPGMDVVSWHQVMGLGQIIVVRLPVTRLQELNRLLKDTAWGVYTIEVYPTYDYKSVGMSKNQRAQ